MSEQERFDDMMRRLLKIHMTKIIKDEEEKKDDDNPA
jgi:hypothetical protein